MSISPGDERLRDAFRTLASESPGRCSDGDLEHVWQAVSGVLPAEERRELIDRAAVDPAFAEVWRIAYEVQRARGESHGEVPGETAAVKPRTWNATWLGLAAALVLVIGLALSQLQPRPADTFRDQGRTAASSLLPSDSTLPRDAFRLRWTPGPPGSTYTVRVTSEDLQLLATAEALALPEFVVPANRLSDVSAGSRVLWQVVTSLPSGENVASETFVVRVQ